MSSAKVRKGNTILNRVFAESEGIDDDGTGIRASYAMEAIKEDLKITLVLVQEGCD